MRTHKTVVSNGSRATDHQRCVAEGPLHSTRWACFFTVAAVAALVLCLWVNFIAPNILLKRAEEMCEQERELQSKQPSWPQMRTMGSACYRALEIQDQYSLIKKIQGFTYFLSAPLYLFYLARRLRARRALEALQTDQRAPVLYLHSFQADRMDEVLRGTSQWVTEEKRLMSYLDQIGPVLAIGEPGEKLTHLGAARLYVSDLDWKNIAQKLMESSRLVVIRIWPIPLTPGLQWELSRVREELPPQKVVLWFPYKLKDPGYTAVRRSVHETLRVQLPEDCPKGLVTFDADWQPRPSKPEIRLPDDLLARPGPGEIGRGDEQPALTENSSAATDSSLSKLLEKLELEMTSPPPFRIHPVVWGAVGIWLILLWGIPGERWSFGLEEFLGLPHFFGIIVEGVITTLLATGLAFIPYLRNPARRLLPSLTLCAILALDGYWVVSRATSYETNPALPVASHETLLNSSTELCRKMMACAPQSEIEQRLSECIDSLLGPASNDVARGTVLQVHREVLTRCSALNCEEFTDCFGEVGLLYLPYKNKQQLLNLVCEAVREAQSRTLGEKAAGPKVTQLANAFEELRNPPLAEAILEEGISTCISEDSENP